MSAVYTLAFRGAGMLDCGTDPFVRMELAAGVIETIGATDEGATVAMPAGSLLASSPLQRDDWAGQLAEISRQHGVGLAFAVDYREDQHWVGARQPGAYAFACERGQRLLWASAATRNRKDELDDRAVQLGGRKVVVLMQSDIFRPAARLIVERARPELTLILAYGGATPRWRPAMAALERLAPVLLVREEMQRRKGAGTDGPLGWQPVVASRTSFLTIHRFSPPQSGSEVTAMAD